MIRNQSLIQSYLAGSASGQKTQAKLEASGLGERCQGEPAMVRREEARRRRLAGSRLGRDSGRVRALVTKPMASASWVPSSAADAVSRQRAVSVMHEIMLDQWHHHPTGELPPRPGALRCVPVIRTHKELPKRSGQAREPGTGSPRPWPQGTQQRQSRGRSAHSGGRICLERQNLRVPRGPVRFMGQVSSTAQAPKWPGRTSSVQPVLRLGNSPQQPLRAPVAVRSC